MFANQEAVRFFGAASQEELVGKPVLDLVNPDCRQIVSHRVRDALAGGGFMPLLEEKLLRLDGSSVDAEVAGGRLVIDGHPTIQVIVRDIAERKRNANVLTARSRLLAFGHR